MKKIKIAWVGTSGFPHGLAEVVRQRLIAKSLIKLQCSVVILNRKGVHNQASNLTIEPQGNYEGIDYIYLSGSAYKPHNFLKRNLKKIAGLTNEIKHLIRNDYNFLVTNTRSFPNVLYYRILSKIFKLKFILSYVEFNSASPDRSLKTRINDFFFEEFAFSLIDGILPISDYLKAFALKKRKTLPALKIPTIVDFSLFANQNGGAGEKYFLFCGAASYAELIEFNIRAFEKINDPEYQLYLVASGNAPEREHIIRLIEMSPKKGLIRMFSNLSYDELIRLYQNASGLLIPLRPIIKDIARFPHKIGEYTASGKPIITTGYGEINHYFKDGVNALIAREYDVDSFSKKMLYVIEKPSESSDIGKAGKVLGLKEFDNLQLGEKIKKFLINLN